METTSENIRQLLEMLDNPDAYTEQEILDIINRDEDTRETYRLMVAAKRSSRQRQADKPIDVDAAWQKLNQKVHPKQHSFGWMKIAASFIGIILMSGIAFAAIWSLTSGPSPKERVVKCSKTTDSVNKSNHSPLFRRGAGGEASTVIYDNIPLEKMLPEIADHYDVKVVFANDKVRGLRFHFVWDPQKGIGQVVRDLNQFERLTVTLKDDVITVE